MTLSANQRGALFMVISQVAFTMNDALVKLTSASIGVGQIITVRSLFATVLVGLLAYRLGHIRSLSTLRNPMVAMRVIGEMAATLTYILALSHLPIANVSAVFQSLPLVVTMSAALFFGEYVGPRRWIAITVGFIGILIIVRPGLEGFSLYSIYVLVCVGFCTVRDLATRRIPPEIPTTYVSLLTSVAVMISGIVVMPFTNGWQPLGSSALLELAASAVLVLTGYHFIIEAMRAGDISFVAPFRYTALLWAIVAGIFMFGDIPDLPMIIGSAIVVASGIYSLYRERVVGRSRPIAESTGPTTAADGL
ncbi:MAG: DMT family transporter [Rhizobiaceae bacterium]|nr:DMT family transporter [Rhizobiaceae bacterium]